MLHAAVEQLRNLIRDFRREVEQSGEYPFQINPADFDAGRSMVALSPEEQVILVREVVDQQITSILHTDARGFFELSALLRALLRKKLPFTCSDLEHLVESIASGRLDGFWSMVAPGGIVKALKDYVAAEGLPLPLRKGLEKLAKSLSNQGYYAESRDLLKRVQALLDEKGDGPAPLELVTDEAWTRALRQALADMDSPARTSWDALLAHCATATASKPSKKWLQAAKTLIDGVGSDSFASVLAAVLAEIGKPGTPPVTYICGHGVPMDATMVHDTHSDLLRGLVWSTSLAGTDPLVTVVGDAADVCFKKIPGIGPRAPKIGNACLWALSNVSSTAAVAQLSRLKTRAKHASTKAQLAKAFDTASEKTGMSAAELEEVAVPTCGLTAVGEFDRQLGDYRVCLRVSDGLSTEISWTRPDGKSQASVPAAVKEAFPEELKSLKRMEKEIDKLLPAQRDRLEQLFLQQRNWTLRQFRARFLDHPLVGTLARRILWKFTAGPRSGDGIWRDGKIVDERSRPLDWIDDETQVSLWHPLGCPVERVLAWREWLQAHQVRQPFKQAHREIYLLTDAERATEVYSNRFAAHLIRQHQFAALCQQRGWRYHLEGAWDSANTPTLELPLWDLRVEFWIEAVSEGGPAVGGNDTSHHGIYLYVATDQVRFYRGGEVVPMPLAEVPPLVFSEVLRDVDLFVGVASIGNDPRWADGGLTGHWRDYWQGYAVADLGATAQTRKAVLERILPSLKIADRCSFSERFLVVRGDLRTYKIHLGSGNVLMEPDDHYLCIVPKQGAAVEPGRRVFLPFDDDHMLSVILSKALMLAEDKKIKDPTITRQLVARPALPVGRPSRGPG